jgi:hypothetical protein
VNESEGKEVTIMTGGWEILEPNQPACNHAGIDHSLRVYLVRSRVTHKTHPRDKIVTKGKTDKQQKYEVIMGLAATKTQPVLFAFILNNGF